MRWRPASRRSGIGDSGQTSLFDLGAEDAAAFERPLPETTEVPVRERLRWEKELLGLYLSEHPMGEVVEQVGQFVTAYSGDLKDESLDGQRIVVAGIVTGFRTVITKAKSTMGVATIEDLQGTIEIVVFPRLYEQTAGTWTEGSILLVTGRIDHRGEEVSLLADLVDRLGRRRLAGTGGVRARGRGRRSGKAVTPASRRSRCQGAAGNGGYAERQRHAATATDLARLAGAGAWPAHARRSRTCRRSAQRRGARSRRDRCRPSPPANRSPRTARCPTWSASLPIATSSPRCPTRRGTGPPARRGAITPPVDASPDAVLHVRFAGGAGTERVVGAMEAFKGLLAERPGSTRVVLHLPAQTGATSLPMELRRGVAYDAELLAEVRRRLGEGIVEVSLG